MENGSTGDAEGGVQYKGEADQEALVTVVQREEVVLEGRITRRRADGAWRMLKCQW